MIIFVLVVAVGISGVPVPQAAALAAFPTIEICQDAKKQYDAAPFDDKRIKFAGTECLEIELKPLGTPV
jgi:hypothetical protein